MRKLRGRVQDGDAQGRRFLNHQMDVSLINELGKEFFRRFDDHGVTKILTIEASGIGIASSPRSILVFRGIR
ncbi:MAG: hypothetical protein ACLUDG_02600 [Butyricicoccus sp.]